MIDKAPESSRQMYWRMLGRKYAHRIGPVTTGADVAFDYMVEHDRYAADRYRLDPNPAEAEKWFAAGFDVELANIPPLTGVDDPHFDPATRTLIDEVLGAPGLKGWSDTKCSVWLTVGAIPQSACSHI